MSADTEPELAATLRAAHRHFLESSRPEWGGYQATALERQTSTGNLTLLLWKPDPGPRRALLWVSQVEGTERVHGVWAERFRAEDLPKLLRDVERAQGAPVAAVTDVLPGVDLPEQEAFFESMGFWHRAKVLMRREPRSWVPTAPRPGAIRPIELRDLTALLDVFIHAYSPRSGEFWTWANPNARADAEHDLRSHRGPGERWEERFLPQASFVWDEGGQLLGAVLVEKSRRDAPYIEDLIVEPAFHRRGIGRALMESTIEELTKERPQAIELAAIRSGAPYRLYLRLGFGEVPAPKGQLDGHWVLGGR